MPITGGYKRKIDWFLKKRGKCQYWFLPWGRGSTGKPRTGDKRGNTGGRVGGRNVRGQQSGAFTKWQLRYE